MPPPQKREKKGGRSRPLPFSFLLLERKRGGGEKGKRAPLSKARPMVTPIRKKKRGGEDVKRNLTGATLPVAFTCQKCEKGKKRKEGKERTG